MPKKPVRNYTLIHEARGPHAVNKAEAEEVAETFLGTLSRYTGPLAIKRTIGVHVPLEDGEGMRIRKVHLPKTDTRHRLLLTRRALELPQNDISGDVRAVHGGEYENTVLGSNYFGLVPITSPLVFESTTLVTMPNSEFNVNDELAAAIGLHETAHTWLLGHCAANSCIMNLDVEPSAYIAASQSDRPFCTAHAVSLQGLSLLENTLNPILDTLPRP